MSAAKKRGRVKPQRAWALCAKPRTVAIDADGHFDVYLTAQEAISAENREEADTMHEVYIVDAEEWREVRGRRGRKR